MDRNGGWQRPAGSRNPGHNPPTRIAPQSPAPQLRQSPAPKPRPRGRHIARKVVGLTLVLVLVAAGFAWYQLDDLSRGMATSQALQGAPASTDGGTNVLLIGLDSRKDQDGNQLPPQILDQLHAGDGFEGGYNTNTMILMHVPANGGQVTAFSIPRDDAVNIPGYGKDKVKEAYGLAKAKAETKLVKQGTKDRHQLETESRDAGRKATLDAIRDLTGVPIDHFAEVNLAGFYDIATALNGVDVCLNRPAQDDFSGANFPAGKQTLNGSQALSFVRQRHGLPNGDLDRTHRQQAFLASASHSLHSPATLLDIPKMLSLKDAAKRDVVMDSGWGAVSFAWTMDNLTGGNTQFQTLPIKRYGTIGGGKDANIIDPDQIRSIIRAAFAAHPTATGLPGTASDSPAIKPAAFTSSTAVTSAPQQTPEGQPVDGGDVPCVN